ncbi:hypothetical protein [Streptacidiphilus sp. PAMC 29251]
MSGKGKKAAVVWLLTHFVDWLINRDGKKHSLPQWQVEIMKVGATAVICAVI